MLESSYEVQDVEITSILRSAVKFFIYFRDAQIIVIIQYYISYIVLLKISYIITEPMFYTHTIQNMKFSF